MSKRLWLHAFLILLASFPANASGQAPQVRLISQATTLVRSDGSIVRYRPASALRVASAQSSVVENPPTPDDFKPCTFRREWAGYNCLGDGKMATTDWGMGFIVNLDGVTPSYSATWSTTGLSRSETYSFNSQCPEGWYFDARGLGSYICWSPGELETAWPYPHKAGAYTFQAFVAGTLLRTDAATVVPGTLEVQSGGAQALLVSTAARSPVVVAIRNYRGESVSFPIQSEYPDAANPFTFAISGPNNQVGATVSPTSAKPGSNGSVSVNVVVGNKTGQYNVTASSADANSTSIPLTAVTRLEPDDNTGDEEGNGEDCELFVADPISIGIGNSYQEETDYRRTGLSLLEFARAYNSRGSKSKLMRNYWTTTFDRAVLPSVLPDAVRVRRPDGRVIPFLKQGGIYQPMRPYFHGTLRTFGTGWQYVDEANTTETYDAQGRWTTIVDTVGRSLTATYNSSGNLTRVAANTGESLTFAYNAYNAIASATDHTGRLWTYTYDGYANLQQLKDADGLYHTYHYDSPHSPYWLSGISLSRSASPTSGDRYVSWEFDAVGRATANYFAGNLRRFGVTYDDVTGDRIVTDPLQNQALFKTRKLNGRGFVDEVVGPGFAACGFADSKVDRDASMNVMRRTTFGRVTEFGGYDGKGQAGFQVEAAGKPTARRTDYTYDPRFIGKLATISRPSVAQGQSKISQLAYNSAGSVIQEHIAGFRPDGTPVSRTQTLEYAGPLGQLSKIDGPRTDVADITRFDYDATSKRLLRVTDPNGVVTRNNITYTPTGQLAAEDRPNGMRVTYSYYAGTDLLKSVTETAAGATRITNWTYTDRRLVASMRVSDGVNSDVVVNFSYDAAGDLIRVSYAEGKIDFTLDAAGNRVQDAYSKLPSNSPVTRWVQRTFGAYGEVRDLVNPQTLISFDTHPEGTLSSATDGRGNETVYSYDDFKRLTQTLQPGQIQISYGYDAQGRLASVTDSNFATTSQLFDDLGNRLEVSSPDSGTTAFEHDAAGNITRSTDAKGQVALFAYDAGNRLRTVDRIGLADGESYSYDACVNGSGQLCSATNGIGDYVNYEYDPWGRVAKLTTNAGAVGYRYDASSQVVEITYPSQRKVRYRRDASGQVSAVTVLDGGNPYPLVTNIARLPLGPAVSWTYGNGVVEARQYDLQYRPVSFNSSGRSSVGYPAYDGNSNPTQRVVNGDNQTLSYDALNRLDMAQGAFGTREYNHDGVGNRTSVTANGVATTYTYEPQSNRLASDSARSYTRDPNGNETQRQGVGGSGFQFAYTAKNRLLSATDVLTPEVSVGAYRYNAFGQRTVKSTSFGDTRFVYGTGGELLAEALASGSIVQEYVYLDGQPVALLGVPAAPAQPFTVDQTVDNAVGVSGCKNIKSQLATGGSYLQCTTTNAATPPYYWPWLAPISGTYSVWVMWPWDTSIRCFRHEGGSACVGAPSSPGNWVDLGSLHLTAGTKSPWVSVQDRPLGNGEYRAELDAVRYVLQYPDSNDRDYKYVHTDALGTPLRVSDKTGTVVWHADYDPFGLAVVFDDPDGDGIRQTLNLRYPGQYYDAETGLHYNYFREYDPTTGRYLRSDPIGLAGGINTFTYAESNPSVAVDPLGLAIVITDMGAGTTTFYPYPEEPWALPIVIDTRNNVTRNAAPGANDPFATENVYHRLRPEERRYGPEGAYLETGDWRGRDVHGGGRCRDVADPFADEQGWCPTLGCTRAQNRDLINFGEAIEQFRARSTHPPLLPPNIPYVRWSGLPYTVPPMIPNRW